MAWFFRYLRGYIFIKICGPDSEKFLNCLAANGIKIWNLFYKEGCIFGNVFSIDFIKIFAIRKTLKCKIKIIKKIGLNFKIKKHKNRLGLFIGMPIFFVILFLFSNFVWIINVEGNKNILSKDVVLACKNIGVYEGMPKYKINNKYDAHRLQLSRGDIAWCSFNIEGCVLTVNLSETKKSDSEERQIPSNIKAVTAGKIKKINVTTGSVEVKVGDYVSKGDLLVSGIIPSMKSTLFVHSNGEIIAQTNRVFSAKGEYKQTKFLETGKNLTRYSIEIFKLQIPFYLGNVSASNIHSCDIKNVMLFNKRIPFKIAKDSYCFTQEETMNYTKEELEEILYSDIKNQTKKFNFIKCTEERKELIENENGVLLNVYFICEENIAKQEIISIK